MLLAVDVQYDEARDCARVAGLVFREWRADAENDAFERTCRGLHPYVPGRFYKRELPCVLPLIEEALAKHPVSTVVVDGYVDLAPGRPGLGRRLYDELVARGHGHVDVVGVAKTGFRGGDQVARPVYRGSSAKPLWVTATGDVMVAAAAVGSMAGEYRVPQLLKRVDQRARGR